jgi:hypothetical protein
MTALVLQITDAGRAAMVDAVGGGTRQVRIAAAGLTAQAFVSAPTLEVLPGEFKRIDAVSGQAVAADTVHLTLRDSGTDSYAVRGFGLYLEDGTLFAVYGQAETILEKAAAATFYLAIDWQLAAADAAAITFGDTAFANPPATETVRGWLNWRAWPKRWPGPWPTRSSRPPHWRKSGRLCQRGATGRARRRGDAGCRW